MAYKLMKRIVLRGGYDKNAVMDKLDAFLAAASPYGATCKEGVIYGSY